MVYQICASMQEAIRLWRKENTNSEERLQYIYFFVVIIVTVILDIGYLLSLFLFTSVQKQFSFMTLVSSLGLIIMSVYNLKNMNLVVSKEKRQDLVDVCNGVLINEYLIRSVEKLDLIIADINEIIHEESRKEDQLIQLYSAGVTLLAAIITTIGGRTILIAMITCLSIIFAVFTWINRKNASKIDYKYIREILYDIRLYKY